jgi:hypothetical protein
MLKKIIWVNFQRITELFTQKIVKKLSKIWVWDPGSEIRKKPIADPGSQIPDSGVKKALDPGSGSATLLGTKCSCTEQNDLAWNEIFLPAAYHLTDSVPCFNKANYPMLCDCYSTACAL